MGIKNLKDTVVAVKRHGVGIKICPVCGSADISAITMTGYITQPAYTCNRCGFQNTIFPEVDAPAKDGAAPTDATRPEDEEDVANPEDDND